MKRYIHLRIFGVFFLLCGLMTAQQMRVEAAVTFSANLLKNIYMRKDTPADFNNFLSTCPAEYKKILLKCLVEKIPSRESEYDASIRKALVWKSYSKSTYLFRNVDMVEYHEILQWAASSFGIDDDTITKASSYTLESIIIGKKIDTNWDAMSFRERIDNALDMIYIKPVFSPIAIPHQPTFNITDALPDVREILSFIIAVHAIKTEQLNNK